MDGYDFNRSPLIQNLTLAVGFADIFSIQDNIFLKLVLFNSTSAILLCKLAGSRYDFGKSRMQKLLQFIYLKNLVALLALAWTSAHSRTTIV